MANEDTVQFLLSMAKEMKRSYENPVIFFTMQDYSDFIFNTLVDVRTAILQNSRPERVLEIVNIFHFKWLQALQDIENFKKRVSDTPRDTILKAIDYTIERVKKRHEYFKRYFKNTVKPSKEAVSTTEKDFLHTDISIIKDMKEIIQFALVEKKKCLSVSVDKEDFYSIVSDEIEELLNWLDRLSDYLTIHLSKVVNLKTVGLTNDLNKIHQRIIDDVANNCTKETKLVGENVGLKSKRQKNVHYVISANNVKIAAVVEKLKNLEHRIGQLQNESSSASMSLQHKVIYLQDRLQSLENLKASYNLLKIKEQSYSTRSDKEFSENYIRIFNHLLPQKQRCRLVEELVKLWESAIIGDHKSIISILSATDIKEVFSDELGNFSIDKYGRKIYKKPNDDELYQLNESRDLVPLRDDENHVYFYDECGRYYLNSNRMRVYKAHDDASEYMLHRGGMMLKLREIENGIEYHYDRLGRYYVTADGTCVYRDKDSESEYVSDGLGNLVRLHDNNAPDYKYCPVDGIQTPSSTYLKDQIGDALKTCLAQVILALPSDPIKHLAGSLEKYYFNKKTKQTRLLEQGEIVAERERVVIGRLEHVSSSILEEQSNADYNFFKYETQFNSDN